MDLRHQQIMDLRHDDIVDYLLPVVPVQVDALYSIVAWEVLSGLLGRCDAGWTDHHHTVIINRLLLHVNNILPSSLWINSVPIDNMDIIKSLALLMYM